MWSFLSRGHGETEGYSNGSLAEFKGNPLQALAREICQNSLDAADGSGKPVRVEFEATRMNIDDFPGMKSMRTVIAACQTFWKGKGDVNTITFLNQANDCLKTASGKFYVLRVSDYNTTGVKGAFSSEDITPWGSLVKGNAFSVKTDVKNAAGSYGIGKAAPFVSSYFQTVFYRTMDLDGVQATLGVARLMAHESIRPVPAGEDPVRRSVGYFGADANGKPAKSIKELDKLNTRTETGTDLFIPGFTAYTSSEDWMKEIFKEIAENFLYSIYSGKLEIKIGQKSLTRKNLGMMLDYIGSKNAKIFYDVIRENPNVVEETLNFHNMGTLRLRLLYAADLNKKILVVRNSGMKIARISSLPRMVSYTGFLELQGDNLNQFFRAMENPSHNAWEPKRHGNPKKAKEYKEEVESWVIQKITEKLMELSGEESLINIGDCFNFTDNEQNPSDQRAQEKITDRSDPATQDTYTPPTPINSLISIHDEGNAKPNKKTSGTANPDGDQEGTRTPTGSNPGGQTTGRPVSPDDNGPDTANTAEGGRPHSVPVKARIISHGEGTNRLIYTAMENITLGRIEVVTKGENGKSLNLRVQSVKGEGVSVENGNIVIRNVIANQKNAVEFTLFDKHNYALGVKAYGN